MDHDTPSEPLRILVCDDDANLRELIRAVLGPGYSFIEAADGNEALLVVRELEPDLIILDVMLPGIGGLDVLRTIRADAALAEIPVVVITAWSHLESQAWSAGADRFVSKPFDLEKLTAAVEELLA